MLSDSAVALLATCVTDGKGWIWVWGDGGEGEGYLSLGGPLHVLLLLEDGIHTLKELHALFGNPAKKRELIDNSSLKIEMKHLEMLIYKKK